MVEETNRADGVEDEDEGGDDLCDEKTVLGDDEVTGDENLPAATGGVEE